MNLSDLRQTQALRATIDLVPINGSEGRLFPPTYPPPSGEKTAVGEKKDPRHVIETLPSGELRVLIDSVASQANRQEKALVDARSAGRINFADIYVDFSRTEAGIDRLSVTEMPHRLADAILRDSEIEGVSFGQSDLGRRLLATTHADHSLILETSPTALLFGCWFSQPGQGRQLKIQRCTTSEIWAHNAVLGQSVGSRIDPLGIERIQLYEAKNGDWTALEEKATQSNGRPKPFPKRPSVLGHGNIAPQARQQGITAERVTLRWALPLAAVRRLRFGNEQRDEAGRAYVVALGVLARILDHEAGYSLRSRCDLISSGPMTIDVIGANGEIEGLTITTDMALDLFHQAEEGLRQAGIAQHGAIEATPSTKLVDLIKANKQAQELGKELAE